tara:strand:- start:1016 stop:1984 length:969 start_codon:yes stop_codon:yes gene_type:complete
MKAISVVGERVEWTEHDDPRPGPGEVLIRVRATAVNRADLLQRAGAYPVPPGASPILGLECAGEIQSIGSGVTRCAIGDPVCALLSGGGYAEQVVVPEGQVLPIPDGLDFVKAAAIPEVFATAWLNLYREGGLTPGERVLLHAGASGVGTAAIQLCRVFGNPCFVTAGSSEKIAACAALGAAGGSVRGEESFLEAIGSWTDGQGVDVILDSVGGAYLADNLQSLSLDGRLVMIGLMGGMESPVNLGLLLMKRLRIIGSTLRSQSDAAKTALMGDLQEKLWPLFACGDIIPVIDSVFSIEEADKGQQWVSGNQTVGKVILTVG